MIKVSAGTASVLGLKKINADTSPTIAYLMTGEKCTHNCGFCGQARESKSNPNSLSRIIWPQFESEEVFELINEAHDQNKLKRACIQVVHGGNSLKDVKEFLERAVKKTNMPIGISANISGLRDVEELLKSGADKVCIALDAATLEVHEKVKGGSFNRKKEILEECGRIFPGKISTHLIVGLGETEEEMIHRIQEMYALDVSVGIFAFTPIKGTKMEDYNPPDIGHYRRIQIANYLLKHKYAKIKDFKFQHKSLVDIGISEEKILEILKDGKAFETAGCPDCNRPYYNEKPGGVMYNYPRPLTQDEIKKGLKESGLGLDKNFNSQRRRLSDEMESY